jgi:disease resistance protein RPM1
MEAALLSGFLNTILTKLLCLAEEKYKVYNGVKDDLVFLDKELRMISSFIDEKLSSDRDDLSHVEKTWIEELRKLSHGIEDCIDNLMYLAIRRRQAPLWLQIGRYPSTQQSFQKLAEKLKRLKEMPAEEHERGGRYRAAPSSTKLAGCLSSSWSDLHSLEAVEKDPVGIDNARDELLAQLEVKAQDQQMRLKVVAIVGLPGSGKTLLARAVYHSQSSKEGFDLRVWVRAAERDPREVLMEILRQLGAPLPALAADHLDVYLRGRLMHKR